MSTWDSSSTIRPATPDDAPSVARIYVESWNAGFGPLMPSRSLHQAEMDRWANELREGPARWWVAESDVIDGFVGITPSRDPVRRGLGELDSIAVDPARWRSGVGRLLMATALQGLREDGYAEGILWTLADYPQGQEFYRATGWTLTNLTRAEGTQIAFRHSLLSPA